jgi:FMN phosphatase YigB (HAD superfamily)
MKLAYVDLDYTVFVNPFWPAVFPYFARHVAAHAPSRPAVGAVVDDLLARSKALSLRDDVAANDWDRLMRECAAGFAVGWTQPVDALVERYRTQASVVPGAHEMLAALRGAGWSCVAASAGLRRYQLPTLRHLALLDCFDELRFADDSGTPKGRRAFYGAIPRDVTHVASIGDSYVEDCLYPAHFGFTAIWFTGARRSPRSACGSAPHAHVRQLERVADALLAVQVEYRRPAGASCPVCDGPASGHEPCPLCRCIARRRDKLWDGQRPPDRRT